MAQRDIIYSGPESLHSENKDFSTSNVETIALDNVDATGFSRFAVTITNYGPDPISLVNIYGSEDTFSYYFYKSNVFPLGIGSGSTSHYEFTTTSHYLRVTVESGGSSNADIYLMGNVSGGGTGTGGSGLTLPPLIGVLDASLVEDPIGTVSWKFLGTNSGGTPYEITSFAGGVDVEVGTTVANPAFTATYNRTPITATLTDNAGSPSKDVSSTPNSFTSDGTFTRNIYGSSVTFTLTAADAYGSDVKTTTYNWLQHIYWGVDSPGGGGSGFITGLSNSLLTSTLTHTFTVDAGNTAANKKIYIAYRTGYGPAAVSVGGLVGGFMIDSTTISVTNGHGFIENYTLLESDNVGLGVIKFTVTNG